MSPVELTADELAKLIEKNFRETTIKKHTTIPAWAMEMLKGIYLAAGLLPRPQRMAAAREALQKYMTPPQAS